MPSTWYTCARKMAVGGMAELLLASQQGLAGFEKLIVIKQILPRLREDKRFVQMFLDEARLAARLRHPCIAEIYDVHRDGESYAVVMEYLSGEDLGYVMRAIAQAESRIPIPFACRILADVADGLHAAHTASDVDGTSHGIIHRDVSPGNIVVTYDGITKLVDFGVAKANENHIYTRPGTIRGKLPYMSPEQVQAKDLDGRSDLFSLGAVFHEMLTSRRLFSGPSESAILKNVMERRIPPPSVYNPRVPPALDEIVLALLERNPERRTTSAATLRDQLEHLVQSDGITQRRVGEWMRTALAPRYLRRRATERSIVEQGRVASGPTPTGVDLPPLFGDDDGPGAAPRDALAAASEVGSVSRTSPSVHLTPSQVHEPGTGSHLHYLQPATGTRSAGPPVVVPRERTGPWVAFGVAVGVIALGALAAVVYLGRPELLGGAAAAPAPAPLPPAAPAPPPAPAASARAADLETVGLLVHVVPEAALLEIDGRPVEQLVGTEGMLVAVPRSAAVQVRISKDGYLAHEAVLHTPGAGTMPIYITLARQGAPAAAPAIELRPTQAPAALTAAVEAAGPRARSAAQLEVAFEPASATLVLDGRPYRGSSPYRTVLGAGAHTVSVGADGFDPVEKRFELAPGVTYEMAVNLSRAALSTGRVDFRSTPMGALVAVNGELKGRTPILGLELPVGRAHPITVTLDGYEPYLTDVEPTAERAVTVDATLTTSVMPPVIPDAAPARPPALASNAPAPPPAPMPGAADHAARPHRTPASSRVVPPSSVTKLSGMLPAIAARKLPSGKTDMSVKLCIDERGRVSSATIGGKLPVDVENQLERAFNDWRYLPYTERGSSISMPVCFAVVFSLKTSADGK